VRALLLTGTVGSGKTAVAQEIGVVLEAAGIPVALVDLDWLGWIHLRSAEEPLDALIARNLAAIRPNLEDAGASHLVMARAVWQARGLDALRKALSGAELRVVRLTAAPEVIAERLRRRDGGQTLAEHLEEAPDMARALEAAKLEDAVVPNEGRPVRETAQEVLRVMHWPGG
jgi:dephospho-CoA kinase